MTRLPRLIRKLIYSTIIILFLASCSSSKFTPPQPNSGRYKQANDSAPKQLQSVDHVKNAVPKYEPLSRGGNKNYTLFGNNYTIIKNPVGYSEKGDASWYGTKFHGYLTSNGEVYDMYAMTAAHKTLPLPSYVKVTNTDNGKSVIVRVNDRGPFHKGRVIDLSYAAAYKLDVYQHGTAPVKVEYIDMSGNKPATTSNQPLYIQAIALSNQAKAQSIAQQLGTMYKTKANLSSSNNLYKVILGPFTNIFDANTALEQLKKSDYPSAFLAK